MFYSSQYQGMASFLPSAICQTRATELGDAYHTKTDEAIDWTVPEHCFYCSDKLSNHPMRSCVSESGLELSGYSDSLDGEPLDLSSTGPPRSPSTGDEASPNKNHVELVVPVIKKSEPKPPKRPASSVLDAPSSKSPRRSLYKSLDVNMTSDYLPYYYSINDWDQKLKEIRRKHNLNGRRRDAFYSHAPYQHELTLPFIPELIRKMAHETMKSHCTEDQPTDLSIRASDQPLDLKIPSYQSEESRELSRDESLKDIISKSLNDKIRSRYPYSTTAALPPLLPAPLPNHNSLPTLVNGQNPVRTETAPKKAKKTKDETPREPGRKGSRPKRGQYRKYNNQLLVEAVKAVQRGEMSVHRAGSYYGVPHSTLEYKVKERHLLRKKKKEAEKAALAEQQAKEGKEASPITPPQPKPVLQPKPVNGNNNKIKNILPATQVQYNANPLLANPALFAWSLDSAFLAPQMLMPGTNLAGQDQDLLYPGGFAMTAPASEMLKKLQQKASSGAVFPGMIETNGDDK